MVKIPPAKAGDTIDICLIPGLERSSGGGHGNPPQYSYLEDPMEREAWQTTVRKVKECWTQSNYVHTCAHYY